MKSMTESCQDWAARLRGLAVPYEFGTELDVLLRVRFNLGTEQDRTFKHDCNTMMPREFYNRESEVASNEAMQWY